MNLDIELGPEKNETKLAVGGHEANAGPRQNKLTPKAMIIEFS